MIKIFEMYLLQNGIDWKIFVPYTMLEHQMFYQFFLAC